MKLNLFFRNIRLRRRQKYYRKYKHCLKDVSIISSNCWGGIIYHDLNSKFLSPTINLSFSKNDFLYFCENLWQIENCFLEETNTNKKYPVGKLSFPNSTSSIDLNFVHYKSFKEAKETFIKRAKRINFSKVVILFTVKEIDDLIVRRFEKLKSYKKICIYQKYCGNENLLLSNSCCFVHYKKSLPKNKDLLSFKHILSRKMYIDDIKFDYLDFIFNE